MRPNTADAEEILSKGENRRHAVEIERPDEKRQQKKQNDDLQLMYAAQQRSHYIAMGKLETDNGDLSLLGRFSKWLKLKIYQFEATYTLTMFSSAEKFVFYSILFLLTSLTMIACFLYLPHHIAFIANRAWFYVHGDNVDVVERTMEAVSELASAKLAAGQATSTSFTVAEKTVSIVREL
ncbi:uncharacterized protein E0L32_012051 [Thyridium curvatum]|uniref:Uncharacterized protein n=1 Tax=Thyridium curvatum TaxID=1093900 RepID=A0A507BLR3_9PEZI|nr:uncharacterized protein E0L32_012051 [Thyridium curvatum]TPX17640.1 hypothetical protein E0L32_012051 [Thyridium curvatum]